VVIKDDQDSSAILVNRSRNKRCLLLNLNVLQSGAYTPPVLWTAFPYKSIIYEYLDTGASHYTERYFV